MDDHRDLYKARRNIGQNKTQAARSRNMQRATNRHDLRAANRNISPVQEQNPVDVPKARRVDLLKQWRIERDLKKQQEASQKKTPFITVVKKGVFTDRTNYIEMNKKNRRKVGAKKQSKIVAASTSSVLTSTQASATIENLNSSYTIVDSEINLEPIALEAGVGETSMTNEPSESQEANFSITPMESQELELIATDEINLENSESIQAKNSDSISPDALIPAKTDESKLNSTFQLLALTENDQHETKPVNSSIASANGEASGSDSAEKTPQKEASLNNSLNYVSPFVTLSRGKRSAQKEGRVRESLYKLETSQPVHLSPTVRRNREAAAYFRNQVTNTTNTLSATADIWSEYKVANGQVDSVFLDQIDVAVGQTKLLIAKKFNQFLGLIQQCEDGSGDKPVLPEDLEGFWSMIYIQVDNVNERFKKLESLKANNWIEVGLTPVKVKKQKKVKVNKKNQGVSASSGLQKAMEAAREKLKESHRSEVAPSNSNGTNHPMVLRNTPARRSSALHNPKTPKSIIKTTGIRRAAKSVAFLGVNSPNLTATPTPKALSKKRRASTSGVTPAQQESDLTRSNSTFTTPRQSIANEQSASTSRRRSYRTRLFSTPVQ